MISRPFLLTISKFNFGKQGFSKQGIIMLNTFCHHYLISEVVSILHTFSHAIITTLGIGILPSSMFQKVTI